MKFSQIFNEHCCREVRTMDFEDEFIEENEKHASTQLL